MMLKAGEKWKIHPVSPVIRFVFPLFDFAG
jgi:hypothetical protein